MRSIKRDKKAISNGAVLCFRCGVCCKKFQVRVDMVEARRIADNLEVDWGTFKSTYLDDRWPGAESFLFRHNQVGCIFLEHKKGSRVSSCTIHNIRPSSCREWIPDWHRTECREGLLVYWGLSADSEGNFVGDQREVDQFNSFLQQLRE
jgi:Fe-S-cluster containining protein